MSIAVGALWWFQSDWRVARAAVSQPAPDPFPDADPVPAPAPVPDADPDPDPDPVPPDPDPPEEDIWTFDAKFDADLLEPILLRPVTVAKMNKGGSSLSIRLDFEGGSRAAFKPEQIHPQTVPRKEIAAYRINRLLGLHSVAPAAPREFSKKSLEKALLAKQPGQLARFRQEAVAREGQVLGVVSFWIPVITRPKIGGHELDSPQGIALWRSYLSQGGVIPKESESLCIQLASLLVFDAVINNPDRFSGGNVRGSKDKKTLYAMDNTLSFGVGPTASDKVMRHLKRTEKFSRRLVRRLRRLREKEVTEILGESAPMPYLVTKQELAQVLVRRDAILQYVDELVAEHGEERVLVFP